MFIYYDSNGKIIYTVLNNSLIQFIKTSNIPLSTLEIDETKENRSVINDVLKTSGKVDINGDGKYYIDTGELYERDGWQEYIEDEG